MYIEKVFSNYEYDENLYSVIMEEDELALFSELQESLYSDDNDGAKGALIGAGLTAGTAGAAYGAYKGAQKVDKTSIGAFARGFKFWDKKSRGNFKRSKLEKVAHKYAKAGNKAAKWVKGNKTLAALAAGGTLAAGAGAGYLANN